MPDRLPAQLENGLDSCAPKDDNAGQKPFLPGSAMLRLTELRLPIDHPSEVLLPAIAKRLGLAVADVVDFTVFKLSLIHISEPTRPY